MVNVGHRALRPGEWPGLGLALGSGLVYEIGCFFGKHCIHIPIDFWIYSYLFLFTSTYFFLNQILCIYWCLCLCHILCRCSCISIFVFSFFISHVGPRSSYRTVVLMTRSWRPLTRRRLGTCRRGGEPSLATYSRGMVMFTFHVCFPEGNRCQKKMFIMEYASVQ